MNDLSTGRGRLAEAARILRIVHKEARPFNIHIWVRKNFWDRRNHEMSCGTVACAAGWIATFPQMKSEGFYLNSGTEMPRYAERDYEFNGLNACQAFFRIGHNIAHDFFIKGGQNAYLEEDVTALDVAEAIEAYLEKEIPDRDFTQDQLRFLSTNSDFGITDGERLWEEVS